MPWEYGMDHDKSRWETVSKKLKKIGFEIMGNDGEYLYWRKWERKKLFEKKTKPLIKIEIKKALVDDYQKKGKK